MKSRINILHISDLHFSATKSHNQKVVIQAFLDDINKIKNTNLRPDIVVFSGDLVQSADENESYNSVYTTLMEPLIDLVGCEETIFLAPGNHDAQRTVINAHSAVQKGLAESGDRDALYRHMNTEQVRDFIRVKFSNYTEFSKALSSKYLVKEDILFSSYYISPMDIAIVSANTSWLTYGGLEDKDDRQKLAYPEAAFLEAITLMPQQANTKILITHHPLSWLADFSLKDIEPRVKSIFSLHLYGHMHDPMPQYTRTVAGSAFSNQCGALYTDREAFNGYAIISVNPKTPHVEVNLRTYFPQRQSFCPAENICERGKFYSSDDAKQFWSLIPEQIDMPRFEKWLAVSALPNLEKSFNEGLADRPLSELFVEPPIARIPDPELNEMQRPEDWIGVGEILTSQDNYAVFAPREYGKTTLLKQIAFRTLKRDVPNTKALLPCMIHFAEIKAGTDRLFKLLRVQVPEDMPEGCTFEKILTEGLALILIDDIDETQERTLAQLKEFISAYPKNKFVFSFRRDPSIAFGKVALPVFPVPLTPLFLKPLSRNMLRRLVKNWGGEYTDTEALLNRMVADIVHINVPLTAASGTILLTIFESQKNTPPTNRAVLIELFVETLLNKANPEEVRRARFDFTFKTHYLAEIAAYMVQQNSYELEHDEIVKITDDFFNNLSMSQNAHEWIQQFLQAKIFQDRGDQISFRYRAFCEYFIALRMEKDEAFRNFILSEENYLDFINEIEYYAARQRGDTGLLEIIAKRFEALTQAIFTPDSWQPNIFNFEKMRRPGRTDGRKEMYARVEKEMQLPALTDEERDELLQGDIPTDLGHRQDVYRPHFTHAPDKWIACLILYSRILKNAEFAPGNIKQMHLARIMKGWSEFSMIQMILIPILAEHRSVVINKIRYIVVMPRSMPNEEVAENIYRGIPRAMSRLIASCLGSEKLEQLLKQELIPSGFEREPAIIKLYRELLYSDLMLPGFITRLDKLNAALKSYDYLREGLLVALRANFKRLALSEEDQTNMRKLIASSAARLYSGRTKDIARNTSNKIEEMKKADLLKKLQYKSDKEEDDDQPQIQIALEEQK